jgi:hypothetical protein
MTIFIYYGTKIKQMDAEYDKIAQQFIDQIQTFREECESRNEYKYTDDPKMSLGHHINNAACNIAAIVSGREMNLGDMFAWNKKNCDELTRTVDAVTWYIHELRTQESFMQSERTLKGTYPDLGGNCGLEYIIAVRERREKNKKST